MPDLVGFLRMMDMNFLFFELIFRNSERKYDRSKATSWLWWYLYGIDYLYLILSLLIFMLCRLPSKQAVDRGGRISFMAVCMHFSLAYRAGTAQGIHVRWRHVHSRDALKYRNVQLKFDLPLLCNDL